MKLLGVRIDEVTREQAQQKVRGFLESGKHKIFTPNPEMLVDASRDVYFKDVLNRSALNIADGKGIEYVTLGKIKRIAGSDFIFDICKIAEETGQSVYLLGTGSDEILHKAEQNLLQQFPKLQIVGTHKGISIDKKKNHGRLILDINEQENDDMIADIALAAPDILFVAFGHVKQEKWIYEYLPDLPKVKIAMGVGGTFDYISGNIKRAPKWMRALGLEWLFRLFVQPQRIGRILKATIVFPLYMLFKR